MNRAQRNIQLSRGQSSGEPLVLPGWFANTVDNKMVVRINKVIGLVSGIHQRADGARVLNSDQATALARLMGVPLAELRKSVRMIVIANR